LDAITKVGKWRHHDWRMAGAFLLLFVAAAWPATGAETFARLQTEEGDILLFLDAELAPHHVDNFVHLAQTGFYEGTYFHRVIPDFMIQGGDPNTKDADPRNDGQGGPTLADVLAPADYAKVEEANRILAARGYAGLDRASLKAEFSPEESHVRGTLSMARAQDPNSAGSQFFICVAPKSHLDGQYSIFGFVVSGMDAVDKIVAGPKRSDIRDMPVQPVHVQKITILDGVAQLTEAERSAWSQRLAEKKGP
jgi:cyclophilin family peptidyl-prolyl cis-trans isomerase